MLLRNKLLAENIQRVRLFSITVKTNEKQSVYGNRPKSRNQGRKGVFQECFYELFTNHHYTNTSEV